MTDSATGRPIVKTTSNQAKEKLSEFVNMNFTRIQLNKLKELVSFDDMQPKEQLVSLIAHDYKLFTIELTNPDQPNITVLGLFDSTETYHAKASSVKGKQALLDFVKTHNDNLGKKAHIAKYENEINWPQNLGQLTQSQALQLALAEPDIVIERHQKEILKILAKGRVVPSEILVDYPQLKTPYQLSSEDFITKHPHLAHAVLANEIDNLLIKGRKLLNESSAIKSNRESNAGVEIIVEIKKVREQIARLESCEVVSSDKEMCKLIQNYLHTLNEDESTKLDEQAIINEHQSLNDGLTAIPTYKFTF